MEPFHPIKPAGCALINTLGKLKSITQRRPKLQPFPPSAILSCALCVMCGLPLLYTYVLVCTQPTKRAASLQGTREFSEQSIISCSVCAADSQKGNCSIGTIRKALHKSTQFAKPQRYDLVRFRIFVLQK